MFSGKETLGGKPFAIFANGSSDWPMHGVFGGKTGVMGFSLDRDGKVINTWGPQGVSLYGNGRCNRFVVNCSSTGNDRHPSSLTSAGI